jgi:hypothetical protein
MIYDEEALTDKIHGFMSRKEIQYPELSSTRGKTHKNLDAIIQRARLPYTHYPRTATNSSL